MIVTIVELLLSDPRELDADAYGQASASLSVGSQILRVLDSTDAYLVVRAAVHLSVSGS